MKQNYITPKTETIVTLAGNVMGLQDLSAGKAHPAPARRISTLRSIDSLGTIGTVK